MEFGRRRRWSVVVAALLKGVTRAVAGSDNDTMHAATLAYCTHIHVNGCKI